MKIRRVSILWVAVLLLGLSQTTLGQATPKVQFSIIYTNDVMGEVEPCG